MRAITHAQAPEDKPNHSTAGAIAADLGKRKLVVFARNCRLFAEDVAVSRLRLIDAVDMLQSAAELSGLCETVGDDVVQRMMAEAFVGRVLK